VADGLITEYLVGSGIGQEANVFLRSTLIRGDFMLVKIAGVLLSGLMLWNINKHSPKVATITVWSSILLYTGIVFWNLGMFLSSL